METLYMAFLAGFVLGGSVGCVAMALGLAAHLGEDDPQDPREFDERILADCTEYHRAINQKHR